jgi:hypothetical protein
VRKAALLAVLAAWVLPAGATEAPRAPFQKVFVPDTVRVQFFPWAGPEHVQAVLEEHGLVPVGGPAAGLVVARSSTGRNAWSLAASLNRSPFVDWAVPHYVLRPAPPPSFVRVRPRP